jgi:hypothetical protein
MSAVVLDISLYALGGWDERDLEVEISPTWELM